MTNLKLEESSVRVIFGVRSDIDKTLSHVSLCLLPLLCKNKHDSQMTEVYMGGRTSCLCGIKGEYPVPSFSSPHQTDELDQTDHVLTALNWN